MLSEGVDSGDRIILLSPIREGDDKRASEAIADVKRMIQQVQPKIEVRTHSIAHDDFEVAVLECSGLITGISESIVINFGGGPRDVYLAFATAVLAHPDAVDKTLQFSDLDGSVQSITLSRIVDRFSDSVLDTLEAIVASDTGLGIPDLANRIGRAKSTVSRHVRQLETANAVETEMHGKNETR